MAARGADSLQGRAGNDVYSWTTSAMWSRRAWRAGPTWWNSLVDYELTANVENLVLQGWDTLGWHGEQPQQPDHRQRRA